MTGLKGVKGQIIVVGVGSFDEDNKHQTMKDLWDNPGTFAVIKHTPLITTSFGFLDFSKKK